MSKLANQWIELFRAGDYGDKGQFTAADVQKLVDCYKPEFHEAPIRIGHTDDDKAPAYGWLEAVRRVGDVLEGKFKQVVPAFAEAVESGSFKKRSIGLKDYGKGLTIRHVAFLGAVPPECKGLADIPFSAEDKDAIEIEFSEETHMAVEQMTDQAFSERMTAFFKNLFGEKPVAKTFSEAEVTAIATAAAKDAAAAAIKPFELKFSERETALSTSESTQRATAAIARVKASGRWVPAFEKMGVEKLFHELAKQTVTVEFGEGATKTEKTQLEVLTEFMESLQKIVPSGSVEIVKAGVRDAKGGANAGAFAVDDSSVRLHEAVAQFAEEKGVTYAVAMDAVLKKDPALGRLGSATAGTV